jgi:hypothetical protein
VPILFVAGLVSIRWRNGGWSAMGLKRPSSWRRVVLIALGAAAVRIVLPEIVIEPVTSRFWPPETAPTGVEEIAGSIPAALKWLLIVWTFAAFGEEIAYRGYLLTRAAEVGRGSTAAYWLAVVAVSVLFGFGHYYKGPAGIVDSGFAGLVLGAAYMLSGRSLWTCVFGHGFIDTAGVVALYFGWAS